MRKNTNTKGKYFFQVLQPHAPNGGTVVEDTMPLSKSPGKNIAFLINQYNTMQINRGASHKLRWVLLYRWMNMGDGACCCG